MQVQLNSYLAAALEDTGYDVAKINSAMTSAYNDGTTVVSQQAKLSGSTANEKTEVVRFREASGKVREGKLTDPLRLLNFSRALGSHLDKFPPHSGVITIDVLPVSSKAWLDRKFRVQEEQGEAMAAPKRGLQPGNGEVAGVK